jgi:glutamate/tyrosine decarboxylase-like PLP-dependent enzyme
LPACVIATAGTTNTGAMDDLTAIGDFCRREGIWFHVDGCIGALVRISHRNAHLVRGIENADSIALDPHKWLQTPFEAGCALVRDGQTLFQTFNLHPAYLEEKPRGVIAGTFLADYGLELSRGMKALKIWMSLREHGVPHFGHLIDQHIGMGAHLAARVDAEPMLECIAPVPLNIVCFRYRPDGADEARLRALNTEIMLRIQESGLAVPSDTEVRGRHALRVAINNHRTRTEDLDMLADAVLETGAALVREGW